MTPDAINGPAFSLSQLIPIVNRQVAVMSCLDIFVGIACLSMGCLVFSLWQKRIV
jgi:hypothetical protein